MSFDDVDIRKIPIDKVVPGDNDRKRFNSKKLESLAESIKGRGLIQPPTVRPISDGMFEIVCGERRFRAVRDYLKWEYLPCIVRDLDYNAAKALMLAENVGRESLSPLEESDAYQKRKDELGWSISKIAKDGGISYARVRSYLALQNLVETARGLVESGNLDVSKAQELVRLDKNRQQFALLVFRERPLMKLASWKAVIDDYYKMQIQETQMDFLDMADQQIKLIDRTDAVPLRGKNAVTGVECDLATINPKPPDKGDTAADIIISYRKFLARAGQHEAAGAIGNLYNELVSMGQISVRRGTVQDETKRLVGEELDIKRRAKQIIVWGRYE